MIQYQLMKLIDRASIVAYSVRSVPQNLLWRWNGFDRKYDNLSVLKIIDDKIYFHRGNDSSAVVCLGSLRESRWGRSETTITIGKWKRLDEVNGDWIGTKDGKRHASWRSFAEFIKAVKGEGSHDLSDHFKANPVEPFILEMLEKERDHKYEIPNVKEEKSDG